jgi:aminoglycoside phosphotransferase (APT) family kinase protein
VILTADNLSGYLETRLGPGSWRVSALGGGVSNTTLLAERGSRRLVIKQSLARLRVEEEWLADQSRIYTECRALRTLRPYLPEGAVPQVVFEDRDNFAFAMEAAGAAARDWKSMLLAGDCDPAIARQAAMIFAAQARCPEAIRFPEQHVFDQLRLDAYYRFTAGRHPDLRDWFEERIEACRRGRGLVHGDFSPKNLLVEGGRVTVIDFEVVHRGDPAFDAAFLLNHFLLKIAHGIPGCRRLAREFWQVARTVVDEQSAIRHLGCLHLARVDGKSPAEYLTGGERESVRRAARKMIADPPASVEEIFA